LPGNLVPDGHRIQAEQFSEAKKEGQQYQVELQGFGVGFSFAAQVRLHGRPRPPRELDQGKPESVSVSCWAASNSNFRKVSFSTSRFCPQWQQNSPAAANLVAQFLHSESAIAIRVPKLSAVF
jgi:hypothetical protein